MRYKQTIRNGSYYDGGFRHAMPAFGEAVLSDSDLDALVKWLLYAAPLGGSDAVNGVPAPERPSGREIVLEIIDEAPWFKDDGRDDRDPFSDSRRVILSEGDYVKVVNRGKTWHTVTNRAAGVDTGFIGYSRNIENEDTGYFYLEIADLASGSWKYFCSLHPYMQTEIVTPGTQPMALTRVNVKRLAPPPTAGIGEVWVGLQTYANGNGPNGAVQVFDSGNWRSTLITNVGNNPHNGWLGVARDENKSLHNVSVWANWHDVTVTVLDADAKVILGDIPVGAANAHVMTAPNPAFGGMHDRWFVTVMGSNKVQEIEPLRMLNASAPHLPAISQSGGQVGNPGFSPHGIWFLDDGEHFVTANSLANSASLYSLYDRWSDGMGRSGVGKEVAQASTGGSLPLAASVFNTGRPKAERYTVYTNNAGTDDISVFVAETREGSKSLNRVPLTGPYANAAGNIALTDLNAQPPRWAHMPIQCAVSPPDATRHGRYMVVCNKASLNVSIVALDDDGLPTGVYTFPGGLGSHGVAFGPKKTKSGRAYYAYVTNTFEDHVSVYDLELLDELVRLERQGAAPDAFRPGGATEEVFIQGLAAEMLLGAASGYVPLTLFSPDARGLVHVGDLALTLPKLASPPAFLEEHVYVAMPGWGPTMLQLEVRTATGAMGVACRPRPLPWYGPSG